MSSFLDYTGLDILVNKIKEVFVRKEHVNYYLANRNWKPEGTHGVISSGYVVPPGTMVKIMLVAVGDIAGASTRVALGEVTIPYDMLKTNPVVLIGGHAMIATGGAVIFKVENDALIHVSQSVQNYNLTHLHYTQTYMFTRPLIPLLN